MGSSIPQSESPWIRRWLLSVIFLILLMVLVGGTTRLTQSGLSMVDWRPLMGVVPPLSLEDWKAAFRQYQQYPEYQLINRGMTLSEFKWIFFWEYVHRLLGRLIGLVYFLPFVFFWSRGFLNRRWKIRLSMGFFLGGLQGGMGWYMVQSGLVDRPEVSHLRLAAHFGLAVAILGYLTWLWLRLRPREMLSPSVIPQPGVLKGALFLLVLISLQMVFGAFAAGLKAGHIYNTFPLMNGRWIPEADILFSLEPMWLNWVDNPTHVQWIHRLLGTLIVAFVGGLAWKLWKADREESSEASTEVKIRMLSVLALVGVQFCLGVGVLLLGVPVSLGVLHQFTACLLFLSVVFVIDSLIKPETSARIGKWQNPS